MYNISSLSVPNSSDNMAFGMSTGKHIAGIAFGPGSQSGAVGVMWYGNGFEFALNWGSASVLYEVNNYGDAVGMRAMGNSTTQIPVLVQNSTVHDLTPAVGEGAIATGINDARQVCGWSWNNPKAFVYDANTNAVIHWIDPLPGGDRSVATVINTNGQVAGTSHNHGFFYNGQLKDLGPAAFVSGLNDSDIVSGSIGKPYPQNFSPAIWDANQVAPTATEIPVPPGFTGGHGEGINNQGDVVGSCWNQNSYNGSQSAFLYSGGVSKDLNDPQAYPGWHLEFAEEINDQGAISGYGTYNGQRTGFLLEPVKQKPPWMHEISLPELVGFIIGGVAVDGGGWIIVGGHPIPVDPWGRWARIHAAKRDALVALAMDEIAMYITDRGTRERVRTELLKGVSESIDRLVTSVGESHPMPTGDVVGTVTALPMQAGRPEILARRFEFRSRQ
jgi:probable HAF family extracellular repeat protein